MAFGTFASRASAEIPPLRVAVYVNNSRRSDIYCTSISQGHGTAGTTAQLIAPRLDWDGGKSAYRGRRVEVRAGYQGGSTYTVFAGYITKPTGSTSGRVLTLEAKSLVALGDEVYIGDGAPDGADRNLEVEYPLWALKGGVRTRTGWTVPGILRDIFQGLPRTWRGGGGALVPEWRSALRLGSLSVLGRVASAIPTGDIGFKQATLRGALDELFQIVGSVSCWEYFLPGGQTVLFFFERGASQAPARRIVVARPGQTARGSNVLSIDHEEDAEVLKTRIVGLGDRRKYVVTVSSAHPTAPLVPDWNPAYEAAVLANPEGPRKGAEEGGTPTESAGWDDAHKRVFRRFKLPECVRVRLLPKSNAVFLTDGTQLEIQVMKWPRRMVKVYVTVPPSWSSEDADQPELLEGWHLDAENGILTLKDAAINTATSQIVDGKPKVTFAPAVVAITLTVAGRRLVHDTGAQASSFTFAGIASAGLTEVVSNPSFGFRQMTNIGFPLEDSAGASHVYGTAWVYLGDGGGWQLYEESPYIMQDDSGIFQAFVEASLKEKNRIPTTYAIATPYFSTGHRIGDRLTIVGQDDFTAGTHQILSLTHNFGRDHGTTISTDNAVPLYASTILKDAKDE